MRKRNRYVVKVMSRYWKTSHKFGTRIPHSVEEALRIDRDTGTNHWRDAIRKEMIHERPAFQPWAGTVEQARSKKEGLIGYQEIKCHMIFDVKMDLTKKARFMAGGHTTDTQTSMTYSSVVSRDSVRIAFTYAALMGIQVWVADIGDAYLNAKCRKRIWTITGKAFGSDEGQVMIIVQS